MSQFSIAKTPRRHLRLSAYAVVVCLVCAAVAARTVRADFIDGSLRVGRELEGLSDVLGSTKTIFINGVAMNVSTAFTDQAPHEVLDRFEAVCEGHPEFLARALSDIPATLKDKAKVSLRGVPSLGVLRKEVDAEGVLTCFTDDRPASIHDLTARMKAFAESKDLAEFGRFRYVYVKRTEAGTHVRTIWTEGGFNLGQMFPAQGDAAGFDSPLVPRPPSAKRVLSATSAEVPYGVHIYESGEPPQAVRRFYDEGMQARGWKRAGAETHDTVVYLRDSGMMVYVSIASKGTRTLVTTTETARIDTPTEAEVHVED